MVTKNAMVKQHLVVNHFLHGSWLWEKFCFLSEEMSSMNGIIWGPLFLILELEIEQILLLKEYEAAKTLCHVPFATHYWFIEYI